MRRRLLAALSSAAAVSLSFVALASSADAAPSHAGFWHRNDHVCSTASPGNAACSAIRHDTLDSSGAPVNTPAAAAPNRGSRTTPNVTPAGYGPADIQSAYNLAGLTGGATVAIVDAYDDPNAEKDLAVYRSQYGLPSCTSSNGCFKKVSQTGSTRLPSRSGGWAQEISLDLDMVSAACPKCKILLVEASSASFANLGAAVNYAATHGAIAISNSYGGSESGTGSYARYYQHPGIAVTASTGDSGYGAQAPASMDGVVAVGGTSLTKASTARGWAETAWSGAGSGCSTLNAKPAYQSGDTDCTMKATADVSAVADPNTGVAVYDSYSYQGYSGWMVFGGTSAASPLVASIYALAGGPGAGVDAASTLWAHASTTALNDVSEGSNATSCPTSRWCHAQTGWDGPTGLGTPNGLGAFTNPS